VAARVPAETEAELDAAEAAATARTAAAAAAAPVKQEQAAAAAAQEGEQQKEQGQAEQQQEQQAEVKQEEGQEAPAAAGTAAEDGKAAVQGLLQDMEADVAAAEAAAQQPVKANVSQQEGAWVERFNGLVLCSTAPLQMTAFGMQAVAATGCPIEVHVCFLLATPLQHELHVCIAASLAGPVRPFVSVDVCPWDAAELPEWQEALRRACQQWQADAAEALAQVRAAQARRREGGAGAAQAWLAAGM